jgi:hypothetical protein
VQHGYEFVKAISCLLYVEWQIHTMIGQVEQDEITDRALDEVVEATTVDEDPGAEFYVLEVIDPYMYIIIVIKSTKSWMIKMTGYLYQK